jgi:hypothetical protein
MNLKGLRQLRTVLLLTLLGIALVLGSSLATAAAGPIAHPPKLLWKTFPLKQRPTGPGVTTRHRSKPHRRTAVSQPALKSATQRSLALILSLSFAALLLGIAALPQAAFPNPRFADALVRRRAVVAAAGAALLLTAVLVALI